MKSNFFIYLFILIFGFFISITKVSAQELACNIKIYDGNVYCIDQNGINQTGFQVINGKTYFFGRMNGIMKTGMFSIDGDYYYFKETTGEMQTGIVKINSENFYFDNQGKRQSGFQTISGSTYFFSRIGNNAMKYGWQNINNYFYYFDKESGQMAIGKLKINNINYEFAETGIVKLKGWNTINGSRYYFNNKYMVVEVGEKLVVDVSYHQGSIDWDKVYNSGIYGVILRIGYWNTEDARFAEYINEVKRLGIPYGIYIFSYANTTNGASIEANFTNSIIKKYNLNPTLGIYYDLEDWYLSADNTSNTLSKTDYDNIASTYINTVSSYVGSKYKVKIYANLNFVNNRFGDYARSQTDWIAHYVSECGYKGNYSLWQYTSEATLDGIRGYVDMSYLY